MYEISKSYSENKRNFCHLSNATSNLAKGHNSNVKMSAFPRRLPGVISMTRKGTKEENYRIVDVL